MTRREVLIYVWVGVPPLLLAVLGLLHLGWVPLYPLLAFAPWLIIRGYDAFLTVLVILLSAVYAVLYTGSVYGWGSTAGTIGSVAFIAACAVTGLASFRRYGLGTVAGSIVLLVGSYLFLTSGISVPVGVIAQLMITIGWCGIIFVVQRYRPDPKPFPKSGAATGKRQTKSSQR